MGSGYGWVEPWAPKEQQPQKVGELGSPGPKVAVGYGLGAERGQEEPRE